MAKTPTKARAPEPADPLAPPPAPLVPEQEPSPPPVPVPPPVPEQKLATDPASLVPSEPVAPPTSPAPEPPAPSWSDTRVEPCFRVTSPGGPRWRAGLQFGREPVLLGAAEIQAAAAAKGITAAAVVELLRDDPLLAVISTERLKAS